MKKNTQTGRSMIEMLGTLAIIGVLSVGGIAGFNTAITKHRTNDITDFLNRTTVLTQALLVNNNLTLASVQDTLDQLNSSYLATAVMCSSGYAVNMAGLPKGVCENFTDMADDNHYIDELKLFIGTDCTPGSVSCTSDDENAISFIFDTNVLSDTLDEDGFYWCEDGTIQNKSGKVATCDCTESDEEFYYDSDEEAIAAMCTEREYTCKSGLAGIYVKTTSGEESVYGYCECDAAKEGPYKSNEEAIEAMCVTSYYYCSNNVYVINAKGNRLVKACTCTSGTTRYFASDEEAIAEMCEKAYYCGGSGVGIEGGSIIYGTCNCKATNGSFSSDEEAIAAMCEDGWYRCSSGVLVHGQYSGFSSGVTVTACNCVSTEYFFMSESEAIAAMCEGEEEEEETTTPNSGDMYTCSGLDGDSGGNDLVIKNNASSVTSCLCNTSKAGYYNSDEEAIAAMCQNKTAYVCSTYGSGRIYEGDRQVVDGCACYTYDVTGYYDSDEDAIIGMCSEVKFTCSNNTLIDNFGFEDIFCGCNDGVSGYYRTIDEAIAALCTVDILFKCVSGNRIWIDGRTDVEHDCTCNSGATGLYNTMDEAIEAMCQN